MIPLGGIKPRFCKNGVRLVFVFFFVIKFGFITRRRVTVMAPINHQIVHQQTTNQTTGAFIVQVRHPNKGFGWKVKKRLKKHFKQPTLFPYIFLLSNVLKYLKKRHLSIVPLLPSFSILIYSSCIKRLGWIHNVHVLKKKIWFLFAKVGMKGIPKKIRIRSDIFPKRILFGYFSDNDDFLNICICVLLIAVYKLLWTHICRVVIKRQMQIYKAMHVFIFPFFVSSLNSSIHCTSVTCNIIYYV